MMFASGWAKGAGDRIARILLLVAAVPVFLSAADNKAPLKSDTRAVLGFENDSEGVVIKPHSASFKIVSEGASQGQKALLMTFDPPEAYPSVHFNQKTPADFRGYGGLVFDVYNPGVETVAFFIRMDSSDKADGSGNHSRGGKGTIDGKQRATFVLPFGVDPAALGMKSLPGSGEYRSMGSSGSGPFDLGHIVDWQIFTVRPHDRLELIIDNVRLIPGRKQDFNQIIDAYGQYSREEWPGKIKKETDFALQRDKEKAELEAAPSLKGRTQYGGWAEGPQLKATGFFRTEKVEGKWSFVDPEGRLFLSFGPTTVGPSSTTLIAGREHMFMVLPDNDPVLARFKSNEGKGVDFFGANLERKYGVDYKKLWFGRTYDRLVSWGFNTIGAFSSWETMNNGKIPYTASVWVPSNHARISTGKEQVRAMSDPYDPQFAVDMASAAQVQAKRVKDDPFFIGYFVGNEEHLGYHRSGSHSHYTLILTALKNKAADSPAKRAFLVLLQKKYGEIAKLNAAWGSKHADWKTLEAPLTFTEPFGPDFLVDLSFLLKDFGRQYFSTVQAELKKADPNHLYLGCRFAGYSPEILEMAAKYSDVLSFNVYRLTIDPKEWTVLEPYDRPVVIGEFHFCAVDRGVFDVGLMGVESQEARGRAYQNYLRSVLSHPKFVGAHWFQYNDQPATGRPMDGENGNVGFVSITDTPYPELIKAAREIHQEMYSLRFGKTRKN